MLVIANTHSVGRHNRRDHHHPHPHHRHHHHHHHHHHHISVLTKIRYQPGHAGETVESGGDADARVSGGIGGTLQRRGQSFPPVVTEGRVRF